MVCEHLERLDRELTAAGIPVVYRDQKPWSQNCRAWTCYACYLDLAALRSRLGIADCVQEYKDIWEGKERGFLCHEHWDAILGDYSQQADRPVVS